MKRQPQDPGYWWLPQTTLLKPLVHHRGLQCTSISYTWLIQTRFPGYLYIATDPLTDTPAIIWTLSTVDQNKPIGGPHRRSYSTFSHGMRGWLRMLYTSSTARYSAMTYHTVSAFSLESMNHLTCLTAAHVEQEGANDENSEHDCNFLQTTRFANLLCTCSLWLYAVDRSSVSQSAG